MAHCTHTHPWRATPCPALPQAFPNALPKPAPPYNMPRRAATVRCALNGTLPLCRCARAGLPATPRAFAVPPAARLFQADTCLPSAQRCHLLLHLHAAHARRAAHTLRLARYLAPRRLHAYARCACCCCVLRWRQHAPDAATPGCPSATPARSCRLPFLLCCLPAFLPALPPRAALLRARLFCAPAALRAMALPLLPAPASSSTAWRSLPLNHLSGSILAWHAHTARARRCAHNTYYAYARALAAAAYAARCAVRCAPRIYVTRHPRPRVPTITTTVTCARATNRIFIQILTCRYVPDEGYGNMRNAACWVLRRRCAGAFPAAATHCLHAALLPPPSPLCASGRPVW